MVDLETSRDGAHHMFVGVTMGQNLKAIMDAEAAVAIWFQTTEPTPATEWLCC
jgi:hypothetical protein